MMSHIRLHFDVLILPFSVWFWAFSLKTIHPQKWHIISPLIWICPSCYLSARMFCSWVAMSFQFVVPASRVFHTPTRPANKLTGISQMSHHSLQRLPLSALILGQINNGGGIDFCFQSGNFFVLCLNELFQKSWGHRFPSANFGAGCGRLFPSTFANLWLGVRQLD